MALFSQMAIPYIYIYIGETKVAIAFSEINTLKKKEKFGVSKGQKKYMNLVIFSKIRDLGSNFFSFFSSLFLKSLPSLVKIINK